MLSTWSTIWNVLSIPTGIVPAGLLLHRRFERTNDSYDRFAPPLIKKAGNFFHSRLGEGLITLAWNQEVVVENSRSFRNRYLQIGGLFSFAFAIFQVSAIFWSPSFLKYCGGPVGMQAEQPILYAVVCLAVGALVAVAGLYAFSGAGWFRRLPFARTVLIAVSAIYLLRGLGILRDVKIIREHPGQELERFAVYSGIALCIGLVHLLGTIQLFKQESATRSPQP